MVGISTLSFIRRSYCSLCLGEGIDTGFSWVSISKAVTVWIATWVQEPISACGWTRWMVWLLANVTGPNLASSQNFWICNHHHHKAQKIEFVMMWAENLEVWDASSQNLLAFHHVCYVVCSIQETTERSCSFLDTCCICVPPYNHPGIILCWSSKLWFILVDFSRKLNCIFCGQLKGLRRKWRNFSTRLRGQRGRGRFVAV